MSAFVTPLIAETTTAARSPGCAREHDFSGGAIALRIGDARATKLVNDPFHSVLWMALPQKSEP